MTQPIVLVTGAAGFIGSHAAEALLQRGCRVIGIDNFCDFYDRSWKEMNIQTIQSEGKLDVEEVDITDGARIDDLIKAAKPQAVLHLAAMAGVRPSIEQPAYYARVNVEGTTHLLEASVKNDVSRFLFASSSSVYGNLARVPFREDDPVAEPISPYAATKRAGELICHTYWHLYRLPVFCLRFFTVYGPRQRPDLAIHKFTRLISQGLAVPMYGDGSSSRDYTYVDDIVHGILAALDRCDRYRIYNLGGSHPVTLKSLITELERAIGKPALIEHHPAQRGDVDRTSADLERSRRELGYTPTTTLEQGLRRFVEWFKRVGERYRLPEKTPPTVR